MMTIIINNHIDQMIKNKLDKLSDDLLFMMDEFKNEIKNMKEEDINENYERCIKLYFDILKIMKYNKDQAQKIYENGKNEIWIINNLNLKNILNFDMCDFKEIRCNVNFNDKLSKIVHEYFNIFKNIVKDKHNSNLYFSDKVINNICVTIKGEELDKNKKLYEFDDILELKLDVNYRQSEIMTLKIKESNSYFLFDEDEYVSSSLNFIKNTFELHNTVKFTYNNNEIREKTKTLKEYFNNFNFLIEIMYDEQNDENNITKITQLLDRNTNVLSAHVDPLNRNLNADDISNFDIRQNILENIK